MKHARSLALELVTMNIDFKQAHDVAFNIAKKVGQILDESLLNPPEIEIKKILLQL